MEAKQNIQDISTIENLIKKEYISLWTKTKEDPFRIELSENLYLTTNELIIIDPDLHVVDTSIPTRVAKYDTILPLWAAPWENVLEGGIKEVYDLKVAYNNDWALVTFDATGKMLFTNNEHMSIFRNVTQLWVKTLEGWRIKHEHVSDGQQAKN
ncbi:MAG: nuclear transport factor 2 family protein [Bacteroidota bacterium]